MTATPGDILTVLGIPAVLIAPDERIFAVNAAAENLLGRNIAGRHFITALRQPSLLETIEQVQRDGKTRETRFLTTEDQHDTTYRVTCGAVPMQGRSGILVSFEDITPVEQAGQMRRDFVANVSHELRTPLTALLGFIETLQGPARNDQAAQARFLGIMAAEAERMNRLVADLLSLSRVEADERVRPIDPVDLRALVEQTRHGLAPLADDAGLSLTVEVPEQKVVVPGDADQLRQVLTNLVENAIKYSGRGRSVRVRLAEPGYETRLRGTGVRIEVSDTGPGIDPVHLPRLTERFYRVDSHRSRELGGTGLGLAIVKHILNRHRGRLQVASQLGQGTTFTVILPLESRSD
ncbi:ATP-binding protein [Marivita sp. XM-24bin2]|jgi:two-component system phosphate regulon sensor histidine kinase PhoR|uniref:sensor histidine kinase n=1 Tax=unclassified Marivita TaxID=2632480 RepID=UPI000D7964ED|nr:ATP-binding protein [Marivita sp. XM-24bin2]MCR9107928.1 ATP-binding protein [Paracoccaceae bacterium]PWL33705.1 MAG: two-component sensor histidine kinase [Marivita sp. XM-24bin2]